MNPSKSNNGVAKFIQGYAVFNAFAWVILMFIIAAVINWGVALGTFVVGLFVSFLLYAFGEIIHLLQGIKDNTNKSADTVVADELPEL